MDSLKQTANVDRSPGIAGLDSDQDSDAAVQRRALQLSSSLMRRQFPVQKQPAPLPLEEAPADQEQLTGDDFRPKSAGARDEAQDRDLPIRSKHTAGRDGDPVQMVSVEHSRSSPQTSAARGVEGASSTLPFANQIQSSFGRHDISDVKASIGGNAAAASDSLGADAYTTGNSIGFRASPDLRLAAHEAAHVVQQRAGVQLKSGVGDIGDKYEQHADAVADHVVAGRSAEAELDMFATGARVNHAAGEATQLKRRKGDSTKHLGGSEGRALEGPLGTRKAGQAGYAKYFQEATPGMATQLEGAFKEYRIEPVSPVVDHLDHHAAIRESEAKWFAKQGWGAPKSIKAIWKSRKEFSEGQAKQWIEDKRQQEANFRSYNAYAPSHNGLIKQLSRIQAQQFMLGITDNAAMKVELYSRLDEAKKVGLRSQAAYAGNVKGGQKIAAPKAAASVTQEIGKVNIASAVTDAAYVDFQRVLLKQDQDWLKKAGSGDRSRLKEINEVKSFAKNVGKTVDVAMTIVKLTPENVVSLAPTAESAGGAIVDLLFYSEVDKITRRLQTLEGLIKAKGLSAEAASLSAKCKRLRIALKQIKSEIKALENVLHDRRNEYRALGVQLDRFSQGDAKSRKEGIATTRGGDRYATMLSLVVEIRTAVAIARGLKGGMPPLEGASFIGNHNQTWAKWAKQILENREGAASTRARLIEPPFGEKAALSAVHQNLKKSDKLGETVIFEFEGVDAAAEEMMKALGGKGQV